MIRISKKDFCDSMNKIQAYVNATIGINSLLEDLHMNYLEFTPADNMMNAYVHMLEILTACESDDEYGSPIFQFLFEPSTKIPGVYTVEDLYDYLLKEDENHK